MPMQDDPAEGMMGALKGYQQGIMAPVNAIAGLGKTVMGMMPGQKPQAPPTGAPAMPAKPHPPLMKGTDDAVVNENIKMLMKAGYSQNDAIKMAKTDAFMQKEKARQAAMGGVASMPGTK